MKKTRFLFALLVVLFASCSKEASFIMEIPELTEGNISVIYADPEQIEAGVQDTLVSAAFANGKFEAVFDSLPFDFDYGDCSVVITDKEHKFACNLPLPMRKGKKTSMKIGELNSFLKGESYLRTTYSGNDYAESFSDFFNKLITESENLQKHSGNAKRIYEKQVALYKSILEKYPKSGAAYSLLIGQIIRTSPNNPLVVLLEGRLIPNCQHSDPPSGLLRRKKICSYQSHSLHPRLLSLLQHSALRRQSQKECDIHAPPSSQKY